MFLERIHIENVRAIAGLELDLDSHNRRWTLLLGENGTGKSTILRCIALLLCGRDALPELLGRDPSNWIRSGQTSARIHGTIATEQGAKRDVHLELRRGDTISRTLDRNAKPLAPLEDALAHTARSYFLAGWAAPHNFSLNFMKPPRYGGRMEIRIKQPHPAARGAGRGRIAGRRGPRAGRGSHL